MIYNQVNPSKMRVFPASVSLFEKTIHFSVTPASAGDVFQVILVRPGDIVLASWATVETAGTTAATIDLGYGTDPDYFGNALKVDATGHCRTTLSGRLIWNAPEVADDTTETNEIEIAGARYGDHVTVSSGMDLADMVLTGEVIHPDWVAVHLTNQTGGALNLASQVLDVAVNKAPQMASPIVMAAADTIDVTANEAITTGVLIVSAVIIRK